MPSLFDDDEPAMRQLTRGELIRAYAQELKSRPPVKSCAGDGPQYDKQRMVISVKDVERVYTAAARLGCTLQLVPLQTGTKPADNPGGRP